MNISEMIVNGFISEIISLVIGLAIGGVVGYNVGIKQKSSQIQKARDNASQVQIGNTNSGSNSGK